MESDRQIMVSSFLEIAVGQSTETAKQFLQATNWKLEDAIQLFYVQNDVGAIASASYSSPVANVLPSSIENYGAWENDVENTHVGNNFVDDVRAPLPVIREALYDASMLYREPRIGYEPHEPSTLIAFRNFNEEMKQPAVWESDQIMESTADASKDNLASLYRPPFALMYHGSFEKAKVAASVQDKWLLVNLQSTKEFSSHMLNRDTWANEAVAQTISSNFIFWQVYEDTSEGRKVCTYYKLESCPVVFVIDPITGQKMRLWFGMIQPERLLEELLIYMEGGPKNRHVSSVSHKRPRENSLTSPNKIKEASPVVVKINEDELQKALAASMENVINQSQVDIEDEIGTICNVDEICSTKVPSYPQLPKEPKGDKNLICRVAVRFPDGRRVQRNFFRTDPLQLLWSFCESHLGERVARPFRLTHAIPGASTYLDYESNLTFEASGIANSMISVTWN